MANLTVLVDKHAQQWRLYCAGRSGSQSGALRRIQCSVFIRPIIEQTHPQLFGGRQKKIRKKQGIRLFCF